MIILKDVTNTINYSLERVAYMLGFYEMRLDEKYQCAGWFNLKRMVETQQKIPNLYYFHKCIREDINDSWESILKCTIINNTNLKFKRLLIKRDIYYNYLSKK